MIRKRVYSAVFFTLFSPLFSLPFFFLSSLAFVFYSSPGAEDPLRMELGSFVYNLRWSIAAAVMTNLLFLDSMLMRFHISLPVLLIGSYVLTYAFPGVERRSVRTLVLLLGSGLFFFVVTYCGLWLGLWEEPSWT